MQDKLLVYGSLMSTIESSIAKLLRANATFLGEARVRGYLFDLGSYPGLKIDYDSDVLVKGHLFQMHNPEYLLAVLDEYEGAANPQVENEYVREESQIDFKGENITCWTYLYNLETDGLPKIESGDYLEFLSNNPDYQKFIASV